jgi:hypothetical protein
MIAPPWFPCFRPGTDRSQTAGDRDLLGFLLAFSRREVRADVDLETAQGLDGQGRVLEIADFLQTDNVGRDLFDIAMDGANLPILFGARRVGPPAGKPLDVPKGGGDGGRGIGGRRRRGWRGCLGGEVAGEEGDDEESQEKAGGHGGKIF